MKVSYVVPYTRYHDSTGLTIGVEKKIQYQEKALKRLSISVNRFELILDSRSPTKFLKSIHNSYQTLHDLFNDKGGDVLYCRNLFPYLSYSLLIGKNKHKKVVFEIQDIALTNKITKSKSLLANFQTAYILFMEHLLGKHILKHASGVVGVTSEITEFYHKRGLIPSLTLGNGISTADIPLKKISTVTNELHVLSVAVIQNYHGIDRFIRGLHEYESTPDKRNIVLHIVGDGPELPHLKEVTAELNLQDRVIFHGFKSGKELDEMFEMCQIALDALAGFRRELTELSSLKSREYCARGIPFIISSKDADFPEGWKYVLKISDDETPIDMNTVVEFANRMMADPEHPQKMRRYAEEHLDWMAKMKVLKEFLESL